MGLLRDIFLIDGFPKPCEPCDSDSDSNFNHSFTYTVYDIYSSEYAHITFSNTIWSKLFEHFHPTLGITPALIHKM